MMFLTLFAVTGLFMGAQSTEHEERLYHDLFAVNHSWVRPADDHNKNVVVNTNFFLLNLVEVDEVNQIMISKLKIKLQWVAHNLRWNPNDYGGVRSLPVPSENIWKPDLVLYNTASGNFQVNTLSHAKIHHNGSVMWTPSVVFRSSCGVDASNFPFDTQQCTLKFGFWTYHKALVDIVINGNGVNRNEYTESGEWELLETSARRHEVKYDCCDEVYPDITLYFHIRRLPIFYVCNLIIPCGLISSLAVLVFTLPSECGEKITLSVSILLSLTVFLLVITEIMPTTSRSSLPLIGEFLLLNMGFVTASILTTVCVLEIYHRSPYTHHMSKNTKIAFMDVLPKMLCTKKPKYVPGFSVNHQPKPISGDEMEDRLSSVGYNLEKQNNFEKTETEGKDINNWKYIAKVADRLLLRIFLVVYIVWTAAIFLIPRPASEALSQSHHTD